MSRELLERYKPAVPKVALLFLAGTMWAGVGTMLCAWATAWLSVAPSASSIALGASGIVLGWTVHHFAFHKIADRNLERLLPLEGKRCLFSFIPWKSYLTILIMVALGTTLRHSSIPKPWLAVLYAAMGLALILSSLRYGQAIIHLRAEESCTI